MKYSKKIVTMEILILLFVSFIYFNLPKNTYQIKTKVIKNCKASELYMSERGKNIYTYCLESIKMKQGKKMVDLKENKTFLEILLNNLTITEALDDGGTQIYKDTKKYTENGLTIVACNTLDGNHDIYIGPEDMQIQENFCKFSADMKEFHAFTKTYHVYHIAKSNDYHYLYLTVRQFQMEEIETVKVPRSLTEHVEVGKNYEFTFQYSKPIEDNLKSIFTDAQLFHVEETDKVGLEQRQDSIK